MSTELPKPTTNLANRRLPTLAALTMLTPSEIESVRNTKKKQLELLAKLRADQKKKDGQAEPYGRQP